MTNYDDLTMTTDIVKYEIICICTVVVDECEE